MIFYKGSREDLTLATHFTNKLLVGRKGFYLEIRNNPQFDMTNVSNEFIANRLATEHKNGEFEVMTYRPWWRWSKAIAMFKRSTPNVIYLNKYRLKRPIESIVGSICHEFVHLVDNKDEVRYGHGSNNPTGKENTAPYKIGRIGKNLARKYFAGTIQKDFSKTII